MTKEIKLPWNTERKKNEQGVSKKVAEKVVKEIAAVIHKHYYEIHRGKCVDFIANHMLILMYAQEKMFEFGVQACESVAGVNVTRKVIEKNKKELFTGEIGTGEFVISIKVRKRE